MCLTDPATTFVNQLHTFMIEQKVLFRIDNMEAALSLLISLSAEHRFGLYKSTAAHKLAANHSQNLGHPCRQLGR